MTALREAERAAAQTTVDETGANASVLTNSVEAGVPAIEAEALKLPAHIDESEKKIEGLFVPTPKSNPSCAIPVTGRPLVDHVRGQACGLLANLIGIPTQPQIGEAVGFLAGLGGFDEAVTTAANTIAAATRAFADAEPNSVVKLVNATLLNSDTAGSGTVDNAFRAVRCIRKGDYDGDGQVDQENCKPDPQ